MKITGDKRKLTVLEMEKEYPDVWVLVTNVEGGSFIGDYKTATGIVHAHTDERKREGELYDLWFELHKINEKTGIFGDISYAPFFSVGPVSKKLGTGVEGGIFDARDSN